MSEAPAKSAEDRIAELEAKLEELDEQNLMLERETARRGVKLSCANIALQRAQIAFDELSKQREQAIQDVAHDLRTPLTSIQGATQNILDGVVGPVTDDVREYIELVHDQSKRLVTVVNWLVEAIRITSDPTPLEIEDSDVTAIVRRVLFALGPLASQRGIELGSSLEPVRACIDPHKLQHVVENLVGNALKYTDSGGTVHVSLVDGALELGIVVKDTGIGMGEDALERIFHRYYRADPSRSGTGLGLLIAREMVRQHGGRIEVESALGVGSTFRVMIPKEAPSRARQSDRQG